MKKILSLFFVALFSVGLWADEYWFSIGCAVANPNDYTVKVGATPKDWSWYEKTMTEVNMTFEGKKLYLGNCNTDNSKQIIGSMGFKLYDGESEEGWSEAIHSWTETNVSTFVNNIFNFETSSWYTRLSFNTSARFYFDATTWNETSLKLWIGHANYQGFYSLSNITNTKLYYGNPGGTWGDAMGIGVVGNTTDVDGNHWPTATIEKSSEYTGWKNYALSSAEANNAYLMVPAGNAGEEPTMSYNDSHETLLNSTQTIKYAVGINGATPTELTSDYVPADIAISSYKFSNEKYDAVDASSGSVTLTKGGSNYSATVTAARTATTTYTVSNIHEDYSFLGWYDAASEGTLLSSELSYTFYPTSATTAYARFSKENNHEVTISRYCTSTSTEINNTSAKVGEVTYSEILAPVIDGYNFINWTVENGLTLKEGDSNTSNPIHVITNASGTYTMIANYEEVLTTDWKLIGDNKENSPFGDDYNYESGKAMSKKTGHSTESNAYITLDITYLPADYYGFKVATASGNADSWGYGNSDGYYITFNREASDIQKQVYNGYQNVLRFIPDALGEYEFRVEYPSDKYVYVTFPTAYAVTYSIGTVEGNDGSISATYSTVSFESGTKIQSGKSVTLTAPDAKSKYVFKGWYDNAEGTGVALEKNATYDATISAETTVYAVYEDDSASALDEAADSKKAVKRIVDGQLVIEREGKMFNALGAEVK